MIRVFAQSIFVAVSCFLSSLALGQEVLESTDATQETPSSPNDAKDGPKHSNRDLNKELIVAVVKNDQDEIKSLLDEGADINGVNELGLTPYIAARITGDVKLAQMLAASGAKTDVEFDSASFVDGSIQRENSEGRPGIAVLIAKGEKVLYSGATGLASVEHNVPITSKTKFRIGSVSKQFAAAAILKLQEDGKLKVQDTISKYVKDFPRGDEVTLHHLLTHTSGLKNYTSAVGFFESVASKVDTPDMIDKFKEAGFDSDPGKKFEYCNTGYYLLSHIVEVVSEKSWETYLRETFFEPLEMENTGTHNSTSGLCS